jgi:hypothetical protein
MSETTLAENPPVQVRTRRRAILPLAGIVACAGALQFVLGLPMRAPRIFGDELIYWELSRSFAWTGHFTVRGGSDPGYGIVYPALIAVAHRATGSEASAYTAAHVINAFVFSLAALPVYAIARRVTGPSSALLAALMSVTVPSVVYTSTIMTENAFYPAFFVTVLAMLRALERPTTSRQLTVVAAGAIMFLIRPQAVVLLPAYALAALLLASIESNAPWTVAVRRAIHTHAPVLVATAVVGVLAASMSLIRGRSLLGPYHVLVSSYSPLSLMRWTLANVADIALYVGVLPAAAFGVVLAGATSRRSPLSMEHRRMAVLTATLGLALLATVAALSASEYGLGRVHERNLFSLAPLLLIVFFAWLEGGLRRPRHTALIVAIVVALLPLAIPSSAVMKSGIDGLALVWWHAMRVPPPFVVFAIVAFAAVNAILFLRVERASLAIRVCVTVMLVTLVGAELRSYADAAPYADNRKNASWIDKAVGADATVVAIVAARSVARLRSERVHAMWSNEFFNRSVRDVLSAGGQLPDGLPVEPITIRANGCVETRVHAAYAVVDANTPLDAPIVARNSATHSILFRLKPHDAMACVAHLNRTRSPGVQP